jgi:hypothetical protein
MASSLNLLYTHTDPPLLPDFYQSKHVVYSLRSFTEFSRRKR